MSRAYPMILLVAIALAIAPVNCAAFQIPDRSLPKSIEGAISPSSQRLSLRPPVVEEEAELPMLMEQSPVRVPQRDTYGYEAPEPIWGVGSTARTRETQNTIPSNVYRPPAKRLKNQSSDTIAADTAPSRPVETTDAPPRFPRTIYDRLGDLPASESVTPGQAPPALKAPAQMQLPKQTGSILPSRPQESAPVSILRSQQRRGPIVENLSDTPLTLATPNPAAPKTKLAGKTVLNLPQTNKPSAEVTIQPTAKAPVPVVSKNSNLRIRVVAPELMLESQPNELTIEVLNLSPDESSPVEVKVTVPDKLTITRFDRDAWLDDEERVIVFPVPSIPGRHKQSIRLRGVSHSSGQHQLSVALVDDQRTLDQSALAFGVVNQTMLMRNAATQPEEQPRPSTQIQR